MTVLQDAPGVYSVTTQSGSEYTVDAREGRCTCSSAQYNLSAGEQCKHELRVAFATGERAIPAWADTDAVDEQLGVHVDATPQVAATDGGVIDAGDEGEILTDSDEGRPRRLRLLGDGRARLLAVFPGRFHRTESGHQRVNHNASLLVF